MTRGSVDGVDVAWGESLEPHLLDHHDGPVLWAVSDLHLRYAANREFVSGLRPRHRDDWLVVAGDVGRPELLHWLWQEVRDRYAVVAWVPGNHDLWSREGDVLGAGVDRYAALIDLCRSYDVLTPEDPWAIVPTARGPRHLALLMTLYDHTFLPDGTTTVAEARARAQEAGVFFMDQFMLRTDPHPSIVQWCHERVAGTTARLDALDPDARTILVNHYPLVRRPVTWFANPHLALWSGTSATQDWATTYRADAVVYGHLHMPHHYREDGIDHHEVSLCYPRERRHGLAGTPRAISLMAPT